MTVSDDEVFTRFPDVLISYDNIEHYRGLLQRRLLINRCDDCGYWVYPHRPICPRCWSWSLTPTEVSGRGRVHLFTQVRQPRANDRAGQRQGAVALIGVELAEQPGLRYLSTVDGMEFADLRHDMPVELTWVERNGQPAPAFRPAAAELSEEAQVG
jgi:uncharacterized OB-fold protein